VSPRRGQSIKFIIRAPPDFIIRTHCPNVQAGAAESLFAAAAVASETSDVRAAHMAAAAHACATIRSAAAPQPRRSSAPQPCSHAAAQIHCHRNRGVFPALAMCGVTALWVNRAAGLREGGDAAPRGCGALRGSQRCHNGCQIAAMRAARQQGRVVARLRRSGYVALRDTRASLCSSAAAARPTRHCIRYVVIVIWPHWHGTVCDSTS
jgi:hypothetical protein